MSMLLTGALSLALANFVGPAAPDAPASEASPVTRRIALIVGVNDGGVGRVKLRYAGSDARSLARVLVELGGLARGDEVVLLEPSQAELLAGFTRAQARVERARAAGERVQFVFYYSGHADERGLLLGAMRLDYAKLRGLIHGVPAQVRLGLLDSCSSGAFVRHKGGRMRPPLATGGDANVEGHAFLTSSSAEEAAQESDRVGGSFFTHYLISGLRGAADVNRDRRITLNEAYRFGFDETLASTETTPGRAQHAAYDIQLVGTGDLVMTDLRETSALLDIGPTVGGRVYIRDARGALAAELYKGVGAGPVSIALEPGRYNVVVDDGTTLSRASLEARAGRKNELTRLDLAAISPEPTTLRGGPGAPPSPQDYRVIPFSLGLVPPLTMNSREKQRKAINHGAINLILGRAHCGPRTASPAAPEPGGLGSQGPRRVDPQVRDSRGRGASGPDPTQVRFRRPGVPRGQYRGHRRAVPRLQDRRMPRAAGVTARAAPAERLTRGSGAMTPLSDCHRAAATAMSRSKPL